MNVHLLRRLSLAAVSLLGLVSIVSAKPAAPADPAVAQLARTGTVSLKAAGPYVEIGTYAIQVSTKLGKPNFSLSDGTWLYEGRAIEGSNATGTLVVKFKDGRVSDLALVTPAVAIAMRTPAKNPDRMVAKTSN